MKLLTTLAAALFCLLLSAQKPPSFELQNEHNSATSVLFSPNGKLIIGSETGKIFLWNPETKNLDNYFEDEKGIIINMACSPDGEILATGGKSDEIYVWSTTKGIVMRKLKGHKGLISSLAISHDGKYLASGGQDKTVIIWNIQTGERFHEFDDHNKSISTLSFAHKTNHLAVGDYEGVIKIYDTDNKVIDRKFNPKAGRIRSIEFAPNDQYLVSGQDDKTVKIWDLNFGACKHTLEGHKKEVYATTFSPDGRYIASSDLNNQLLIWDLKTQEIVHDIHGFYKLLSLSFSYDGKYLASADFEAKAEIFDISSLKINEDNALNIVASRNSGVVNAAPSIEITQPIASRGETYLHSEKYLKVKGKVECQAGLFLLLVNGTEVEVDAQGYFEKDVLIPYLESELIVKAIDREKQVKETSIQVNRPLQKGDVLANRIRQGRDYALIIGTNEYESLNNLVNPIPDAEAIEKELKERYGFTTELLRNPSMKEILLAIRKYSTMQFNDQDQLFIFFAGHGTFDQASNQGYLVCSDSEEDDIVRLSYLSYERSKASFDGIPCQHIFLVIDACFGGTFGQSAHRGNEDADVNINEFINRKMKYKTRHYLTSGGKEYVSDGRPGEHSPFTRHFLEALRNNGGADKVLTQSELQIYVEKNPTQPHFGEFGSNEPGSDFLFIVNQE